MGTTWSARFYRSPDLDLNALTEKIRCCFRDITAELSTWEPNSFISELNGSRLGQRFRPPPHFLAVWTASCEIARRSNGAFTPFALDWLNSVGLGPTGRETASESLPPWQTAEILLDADGMISRPSDGRIDLSATGKGYGVDQLASCLRSHGIACFLVEIGGEFASSGSKADGQPWWVDVERSTGDGPALRVALCGQAIATSGLLQQSMRGQRQFQSHIFGADADDMAQSVTVISNSCISADGWATALIAAGKEGKSLANAAGVAAVFQTESGCEFSLAAEAYL